MCGFCKRYLLTRHQVVFFGGNDSDPDSVGGASGWRQCCSLRHLLKSRSRTAIPVYDSSCYPSRLAVIFRIQVKGLIPCHFGEEPTKDKRLTGVSPRRLIPRYAIFGSHHKLSRLHLGIALPGRPVELVLSSGISAILELLRLFDFFEHISVVRWPFVRGKYGVEDDSVLLAPLLKNGTIFL